MSFLFYDYETSGLNADFDQVLQFAAVRTDDNLNLIGDPHNILCKPRNDIIPSPIATMTHKIPIALAENEGYVEFEFSKIVSEIMSGDGDQCVVGYNSLSFDDEFTRRLFYRNLTDPYAREWRNKNSRADILPLVFAAYALRPDVMEWPIDENGDPSFKLENLTRENGIEHENAHDALSDVYATIAIAKLVKNSNPRLFQHIMDLRNKHRAKELIDASINKNKPLLHVSRFYGHENRFLSLVTPIGYDKKNKNAVLYCDLRKDPRQILGMDPAEIRNVMFTKKDLLTEDFPEVPFGSMQLNKMPTVFNTDGLLTADLASKANLDIDQCMENAEFIRNSRELAALARQVFDSEMESHADIDAQIYTGGFFKDNDRRLMDRIVSSQPGEWADILIGAGDFDPRISEITFRIIARNYPHLLDDDEKTQWDDYKNFKLTEADANLGRNIFDFEKSLSEAHQNHTLSNQDKMTLNELDEHVRNSCLSPTTNRSHNKNKKSEYTP